MGFNLFNWCSYFFNNLCSSGFCGNCFSSLGFNWCSCFFSSRCSSCFFSSLGSSSLFCSFYSSSFSLCFGNSSLSSCSFFSLLSSFLSLLGSPSNLCSFNSSLINNNRSCHPGFGSFPGYFVCTNFVADNVRTICSLKLHLIKKVNISKFILEVFKAEEFLVILVPKDYKAASLLPLTGKFMNLPDPVTINHIKYKKG